ncbi:hypothetical protein E6P09_13045 [Haloferax mediterranei ATCC 33500]|uniref:DUF8014 domain-containing protein n=2 Tax=Haloferacaceae TaxID=1644056 RepID=I3R863_HALMT|nr:hypothetical protein HFX_2746 [Haloferax mediterranei ATCC 33500]ELZ98207.1 hypothetical protein C439_15520 [Haloferax mediterranei ATCC 33500]QCQ76145.1 hypothetical protein E6P09_13045 [Haloferax mediterranei ATCC 33500]
MVVGADRFRMAECSESDCENVAAVRLYIPWDADRNVCTAHARTLAQQDGVVAEPLDGAAENWS